MQISKTHHSLDPNNVNSGKQQEMGSCPHLIMQDGKLTPICHFSSIHPYCPAKVFLVVLRWCHIYAYKVVQAVTWYPLHIMVLLLPPGYLLSSFPVLLLFVYQLPYTNQCCYTCCTLPLVVNTSSPFTRYCNLPCVPVLLPLPFLTNSQPRTPDKKCHAALLGTAVVFVYIALGPSDTWVWWSMPNWRRKSLSFWVTLLNK